MHRASRHRRPRHLRPVFLVAVVIGVVGTGGVASAHWLTSGHGSGSGTTGTTALLTLSPGTAAANLYPGGRTAVVLTVSNPNTSSVFVGSLQLDATRGSGGFAVDSGHSGCTVSSLSYTAQTNAGAGWTVPAKVGAVNGSLPVTLPSALSMSVAADNACQGATFTIYLAATS
jgi:hypothetical protein